eukprot:3711992-Prymnesium_polylepis.1
MQHLHDLARPVLRLAVPAVDGDRRVRAARCGRDGARGRVVARRHDGRVARQLRWAGRRRERLCLVAVEEDVQRAQSRVAEARAPLCIDHLAHSGHLCARARQAAFRRVTRGLAPRATSRR